MGISLASRTEHLLVEIVQLGTIVEGELVQLVEHSQQVGHVLAWNITTITKQTDNSQVQLAKLTTN